MTTAQPPTSFKLNTGASIPAVGLGTWQAEPGEVRKAVAIALKNGYRHIDAALVYGNENEVGQGIKDSGVKREDIFITSKVWNTYHDRVAEGLKQTLEALGTDYLDLYLIHWPVRLNQTKNDKELEPKKSDGSLDVDRSWDQAKTWAQLEEVYAQGKVKAIGVANWSIQELEKLKKTWKVVPAVDQVELHPYLPQHDLVKWLKENGIQLEAYSPLGSSDAPFIKDETINAIAKKHDVGPATILISYHVNRGTVVIPKSVTEKRIIDNLRTIKLDDDDVKKLDGLNVDGKQKRVNTPDWGWDLGFKDWYEAGKK
ncbi:hypothetical protein IAT38_006995 [Cryptococcus sp. DSM 104549]